MKEKLLNNLSMKILSIILAIFLWLMVVNVDDSYVIKTYFDIPVEIINGDVLTSANKAWDVIEGDKVNITIKAKRSVIDNLQKSDIQATADLSKLSIVNSVPIEVTVTKYTDRITEKNLGKVNTLKVSIENIATKQFPVKVEATGEPASGYALGSKTATPNIVEVSGPESLVRRVNEVRVTTNIQGIKQSQRSEIEPVFYNYDGDILDSSRLKCNVNTVNVVVQVLKTKEVSLNVEATGKPQDGYAVSSINFEPQKIMIAGSQSKLDKIDQIPISDLSIEGRTSDLEKNIDLSGYLPEGIILAEEGKEVVVTIKIEKLAEKTITFSVSDISLDNIPDGLKVKFDKPALKFSVKMRGLSETLSKITASKLKPSLDLADLSEGEHTVSINLKDIDGISYLSKPKVKFALENETPTTENTPTTERTQDTTVEEEE